MSSNDKSVVVVGSGKMGQAYSKVLIDLGIQFTLVGRSTARIEGYKELFPSVKAFAGGVEGYLQDHAAPESVIIAANITLMANIARNFIESGTKNILLEKPGSLSIEVLLELKKLADEKGALVFIGYNRRFYTSVLEAQKIIQEDGGLSSFHFEFTEMIHKIKPEKHGPEALARWVISNSSHVIDTAFFLGGHPKELMAKVSGNDIEWHPAGSIFTGMGETEDGIHFTYHANWGSAGRWNLELNTNKRKLIFSPMEKLRVQYRGEMNIEEIKLDYHLDDNYKPGIFLQTKAFLYENKPNGLLGIDDLIAKMKLYHRIANYY